MTITEYECERAISRSRRKFQTDMDSNMATAIDNRVAEIARNMIAEGEPTEKIIRYTGLTVKDIENL